MTTATHDVGSYFDLAPADLGEDARRAIVDALEQMGFEVEAAHHEVAHGQHEIDFRYADALTTADNITTFRFVVKYVAQQFGLVASFMPKPIFGQNGSGMHTHQSLFHDGTNAFWQSGAQWELSEIALHYIGGLLQHVRGFAAFTGLEDEKLGFHAGVHRESEFGRAGNLSLQDTARIAVEGGAIGSRDVADEARNAACGITPRKNPERRQVRSEQHVRLFDTNEPLDRGPVEHDVAGERLLELRARNLDVLVDAEDVGELQPQEAHVLRRHEAEQFLARNAGAGGSGQ